MANLITQSLTELPDWKNYTLLIADDDPSAHALLGGILKPTGINIYSVYDGAEAFAACIEHPEIQVIIMDIRMPEMNGIELAEKLTRWIPQAGVQKCSLASQLPVATSSFSRQEVVLWVRHSSFLL